MLTRVRRGSTNASVCMFSVKLRIRRQGYKRDVEEKAAVMDDSSLEQSIPNGKVELSVDEVIERYVGGIGKSQILQASIVSFAWIFDAQSTLITIFSDAQPPWRCNPNSSSCSSDLPFCELPQGSWEWVHGEKSSIVAEWELVCDDKFRAGIPSSLFFLGSFLGAAVNGRLADTYLGRKKTLLLSCFLAAVTGFLTSVAPNLWVYAFLRFLNGFSRSGLGTCCLVLATEGVGRKYRGQVGQYGFFLFALGFLSLPAIAYPTRASWRNMYRIISGIPLVYTLIALPLVWESPRWLAVVGRTKEAHEVLKKLARTNGKTLPENLNIEKPVTRSEESIWAARWAIKRTILLSLMGFAVGLVYYGVPLNAENLDFNIYITVAVNAVMEIPAALLAGVLLAFTDRRLLFSLSSIIAAAACGACIFLGRSKMKKGSWPKLTVESIGFLAAALAYDVLHSYGVELFPTSVRNFAVAVMRQSPMLGAAIASQVVVMGRVSPKLSFLVFACSALFSAFFTLWLPETRKAPLYETMAQQEEEEKRAGRNPPLPNA